ncbi:MAG: TadE/TadG family type IV pilus assembly protein [Sphingomicrobium sp.]
MTALSRLARDERGNSFVEMALAAPLFAALLVGTVDISRAYAARIELEQAAQRATEKVQASIYVETDNATLKTEAETAAGSGSTATVTSWLQCGSSASKLSYSGTCADGETLARYVQVGITKSYTPLFSARIFANKNSNGTVPLTGKSGVRVQ